MKKHKEWYYLLVFLIICAMSFAVYFEGTKKQLLLIEENQIENGILDFSNIDILNHNIIGLEGDVEFYWQKLLTPSDFKNDTTLRPDGYIKIPGVWNKFEIDGEKIGGFGYATYRFVINVQEEGNYGIRIIEFDTAYKIWANSTHVASAGVVGTSKESSKPDWKRNELLVQSHDKKIEVIIQISNFTHRKGGAEDRMYFGSADSILTNKNRQILISALLLGILLMLSLYHFVLYLFRPTEISVIIFSVLCFFMSLRLMATGEKLLIDMFPNINWFLAIRIEYLSYKIALPLLFAFFYYFFKEYIPRWIVKTTFIFAAIFCLIVLFTPVRIFSYTPLVYQVLVAFDAVYMFYVLIKASIDKKENALIFLTGYVLFLGILINDILFYNKIINTSFMMHLGLFILAVSQSFLVSRDYAYTFYNNEALSQRLEKYNRELEAKVHDRTIQIKNQKDEIELQARNLQKANKELRELTNFKENLSQMIVHDLKNPLNVVLNYSQNDKVTSAGKQMLNLVYNILDVQKYDKKSMKLSKSAHDIEPIIESVLQQVQSFVNQKSIQLSYSYPKNIFVNVDIDIIDRVLVNLLSNAIKFSPYGGKIDVSAQTTNNKVKILVSDSGPGIPPEMKNLVFQKFGQYEKNDFHINGSSGIGLAFCKIAIEAHGGNIDFISEVDKGSTFWIELPLAEENYSTHESSMDELFHNKSGSVVLSEHDKQLLATYVDDLRNTKLYEIGKLKEILSKIDVDNSQTLTAWINQIKSAIYNSDYLLYHKLLDVVKS